MTITRDLQIALARYNAGITRARREYAKHSHSGVDWCPVCINALTSEGRCKTCYDVARLRQIRAEKVADS